jgi:hypothetical protein
MHTCTYVFAIEIEIQKVYLMELSLSSSFWGLPDKEEKSKKRL